MKSVKLSALLLGATLFIGMGVTTLSADMKCGAGKCGASMQTPKKNMNNRDGKCGDGDYRMRRDGKCGDGDYRMRKDGKCGDGDYRMRGDGKYGGSGKGMMNNNGKCGANN